MPEKQLNFVHIFDEAEKEAPKAPAELPAEDNEEVSDPISADRDENRQREEAEIIFQGKEKEEQTAQKQEHRTALLLATSPKLEDFQEYMPEIRAYGERMNLFRNNFQKAEGPEKKKIYEILVRPDLNDEPNLRDSARLYLKFLDVAASIQAAKKTTEGFYGGQRRYDTKKGRNNNRAKATVIKTPAKVRDIDLKSGKNAAARMDD